MKGMIFRAFIDHVEDAYGLNVADAMIESCNLPTDAAYTTVGTYDVAELVQMLGKLTELTNTRIPTVLNQFGEHLFFNLANSHRGLLGEVNDSFSLISKIDNHIHVEVRKLYPDADLPDFTFESVGPDQLTLTYQSKRGLADLAEGLLRGCFAYFKESVEIMREDISGGDSKHVKFTLERSRPNHG